ncbi:MAG: hypothetical protein AAF039_07145 [Bacteroidota bacterium]
MKSKSITRKLTVLTFLLVFIGCQKDGTAPEEQISEELTEEFESVYFEGMAGVETGNPDFPYMVQHENGEVMVLNAVGDTPKGVIYFVDENTTAHMEFDEDFLPSQVNYNNEVLVLFENYRDDLVDIAVIVDGDFQIYRDIDFPMQNVSKGIVGLRNMSNWSGFFSALGTTINVGLCGIAAAATAIPSLGTSVPAAVITCGGALLGSVLLLRPSDSDALNATGSTVGIAANGYGCLGSAVSGNPLSIAANCINTMIDAAGGLASLRENLTSTLSEIIAAARGGLETGDGDVKFTLTWDNDTDLDLYVTEPSGDTIWFGNRTSTTGGQLDVDDIDGFGPENIFWPTDFARPGEYRVEVNMFSGNKSTTFRVKPKLGDNNFSNTVVLGIESNGQTVFVGSYILSPGNSGKLVGKWEPNKSLKQLPSITTSLSRQKTYKK